MSNFRERREFQRLHLERPIPGRFGDRDVQILEMGVLGARLSHTDPIPEGEAGILRFEWEDTSVALESKVVRNVSHAPAPEGQAAIYQSGLRFTTAIGESDNALRRLLASHVRQILQERKDISGSSPVIDDGEETLTDKSAPFVTYYMSEGEWHKRPALVPDQPLSGFTVAAGEDEVEMKLLRQVYENADTDGMHLIRLFAELSISEKLGVPRKQE
ncbi:MAG TPA: hypothetical protein VM534_06580 [Thermoanaerobaculia bacterium]|nr:hypothetical protein [Thermoanaerobaculia bacterium]